MLVADVDDNGYLMFTPDGGSSSQAWYEYDHWRLFFDAGTRYLAGQCCTVRTRLQADGCAFDGPGLAIGPSCKAYLYTDPSGLVGHVFVGLIDELGQELRIGVHPWMFIRGVTTSPTAEIGGAVVLATLFGVGAVAAAAYFGGVAITALAGKVLLVTAVPAGAFGVVAGTAAGSTGIGKLEDDGATLHEFEVCRGWDISRAEYDQILSNLKDWKEKSDTRQLFYDVTGQSVHLFGKYAGQCCTFATDAFATVGIQLPLPSDSDLRRPGRFDTALLADPRREVNTTPLETDAFHHPWTYAKPPRYPMLTIDATLGTYAAPEEALPLPNPSEVVPLPPSSSPEPGPGFYAPPGSSRFMKR